MILSYRKRPSSPELETTMSNRPSSSNIVNHSKHNQPSTSFSTKNEPLPGCSTSDNNRLSQPPLSHNNKTALNPIAHHRKNKSFSSFFQNLFSGNNSDYNNKKLLLNEIASNDHCNNSSNNTNVIALKTNDDAIPGPSRQINNDRGNSKQKVTVEQNVPGMKRNSSITSENSYHNSGYDYSSSSESINTILSTNSFSFVQPKKYKNKKIRGKRIPIEENELEREVKPVKLRTQHAQPLPNSRRKKLSTLSRLSMKIGLKSKYNLQSCESIAGASSSLHKNENVRKIETMTATTSGSSGSRTRSNKRRAPLPPSLPIAPTSSKSYSNRHYRNQGHGSSSSSFVSKNYDCEPVQLKSFTKTSSYEKIQPTSSKTNNSNESNIHNEHRQSNEVTKSPHSQQGMSISTHFSPNNDSTPSTSQSKQESLQHRRCFSEGSSYDSSHNPRSRIYYHVRGKRKAPIPPVRLIAASKISSESQKQPTLPPAPRLVSDPQIQTMAVAQTQSRNVEGTAKPNVSNHNDQHQLQLSAVSEEEEIVQNILNAKQEEQKIVSHENKSTKNNPGTSGLRNHNSSIIVISTTQPNVIKTSATSGNNLQKQPDDELPGPSRIINFSKCFLSAESDKNKSKEKNNSKLAESQIRQHHTTTLSCYESFDGEEDDNEVSMNSLQVHEKKLNDQVKSQLTKSIAQNTPNSKDNNNTKMPFFFKLKKSDGKNVSRSQYANGRSLFQQNITEQNNANSAVDPTAFYFDSPTSPISPTTPTSSSTAFPYNNTKTASADEPVTPTKMTPRPWYKRSSKDKSNSPGPSSSSSTSNNNNTRIKPSISILTKISELDREAAKIVEEKRRRSAAEQNYNESTRDLITMFNTAFTNPSSPSFSSTKANPKILQMNDSNNSQSSHSKDNSRTTFPVNSSTVAVSSDPSSASRFVNSKNQSMNYVGGSGIDERKKLAIVQPQSNPNFKSAARPASTPNPTVSVGRIQQDSSIDNYFPEGEYRIAMATSTNEDWSCPRCTLKNPAWRSFCDACHFKQGSTNVHSIASMFENTRSPTESPKSNVRRVSLGNPSSTTENTSNRDTSNNNINRRHTPSSSSMAENRTAFPSSNISRQSSVKTPACENFLSNIQNKEKEITPKSLEGLKLHADDPEVEEIDIEKLRRARLAFFAKSKSPSNILSCEATSNSMDDQPNSFKEISKPKKDVNGTSSDNHKKATKSETGDEYDQTFDAVIQLHQQLNPNISNTGPTAWKPFYPQKFQPNLESIVETSVKKSHLTSSKASTENYLRVTKPTSKTVELDPTYENWHLKLSEFEKDEKRIKQGSTNTFIRNIRIEIKDQINYFDRLRQQLREERSETPEDDNGEDYTSESDASTVIEVESNKIGIMDKCRRYPNASNQYKNSGAGGSEFSRRRISLGEADYDSRNGGIAGTSQDFRTSFGSMERNKEPRRSSYDHDPEFNLRKTPSTHQGPRRHVLSDDEHEKRAKHRQLEQSTSKISKLLRKLEWAINVGDHKLAASLAHDLAILKVNCTVEKSSVPLTCVVTRVNIIRVYVEDRFMQQGPFQVPVTSTTTVKELKTKIECDWGIPVPFQKWILRKKIADDDTQSLTDYDVIQDSMAFLYLVTPFEGKQELEGNKLEAAKKQECPKSSAERNPTLMNSQPCSSTNHFPAKVDMRSSVNKDKIEKKDFQAVALTNKGTDTLSSNPPTSVQQFPSKNETTAKQLSTQTKNTSTSTKETAPAGAKNDSCRNLPPDLVGTEIPNSTKNVSTKYVQSVKQSISEESSSLPNATLKQGIKNHISAEGSESMKQNKNKDSEKNLKAHSASENGSSKTNLIKLSIPQTQLNRNQELIVTTLTTPVKNNSSTTTDVLVKNQMPSALDKRTDLDLKGTQDFKPNKDTKIHPTSAIVKNQATEDKILERSEIKSQQGKERLLETKEELSNKSNKSVGFSRKAATDKEVATGTGKSKNSMQTSQPILRTNSIDTELKSKPANPPQSPQLLHKSTLSKPVVLSESNQNGQIEATKTKENVQLKIHTNSKVSEKPTLGQTSSEIIKKTNIEKVNKLAEIGINTNSSMVAHPHVMKSSDFHTKEENGATSKNVKIQSNPVEAHKPDLIPPNPEPPITISQIQSKPSNQSRSKNRWGSPNSSNETKISNFEKAASTTQKGEELKKSLNSRKDSDAIDINLQVSFNETHKNDTSMKTIENIVPSSSIGSSTDTAAAAGYDPIEKKEDNNETYRKMLQLMENDDFVKNTEEVECPICFNKIAIGVGVTLRDCLHSFCRECLSGTIQYSDEPQVKCPFRDNNYSCESFLQEREIKGLVSPLMFERHLAQAVKLAENKIANTFHCKTNDCTGWCIFEDDVNVFNCPVCRKSNCLTCQAIHEGKNCQEFQRELALIAETDEGAKSSRIMLEKMIQRGEALECPACHVVLLKKWGCDWVRCSYCKTEICWVTKSFRWGKNGKGDTSGGCKCGVNGVKCHPKCTYCH